MSILKASLFMAAKALKMSAIMAQYFPWIAAFVCIVSPISPHVRMGDVYSCSYIGTRGVVYKRSHTSCGFVEIIDTRTGASVW